MKIGEKQLDSWKTEKNLYAALAVRLTACAERLAS